MGDSVMEMLKQVASGSPLSQDQAETFMDCVMNGQVTPVQVAGMVSAMTVRGERVDEIIGFARGMRKNSLRLSNVPPSTVDTCGTGGDGQNTFNISTAAAIVSASAGAVVAKHGNRAASSKSGSADVLQALGANIHLSTQGAKACLDETGLCFMFAQAFHPAMKHAAGARKELGYRTIFNILGPLTNPAGAKRQLLGVFRADLVKPMAEALQSLGSEHVMVVHGVGGLDEISISGDTLVAEINGGQIQEYTLHPKTFGLNVSPMESLRGGTAEDNARTIRAVLTGQRGPERDIVVLNAGAVLYVSHQVPSIEDGVQLAEQVIDSGAAASKLDQFIQSTQTHGEQGASS